jgi:hypothetical protein
MTRDQMKALFEMSFGRGTCYLRASAAGSEMELDVPPDPADFEAAAASYAAADFQRQIREGL